MNQSNSRAKPEQGTTHSGPYASRHNVATGFLPCLIRILTGTYSVIFLATPPAVTEEYLKLLLLCLRRRCLVVAEKPWASSLTSALQLQKFLDRSGIPVRFNDHYLAKQVMLWLLQQPLAFLLGGPVLSVKARLFETPGRLSHAMGTTGMLHDLLIHLVTVVHRLFPGERIAVTDAFGSRHNSWPYQTESFARVLGVIDTERLRVSVSLAAAKDCPAAEKVMLIEGPEATLHIDFAQEQAELEYRDGSRRIVFPKPTTTAEKPYAYLLRRLNEGDVSIGLDIHEALSVLRVLDDAKRLFSNPLPEYDKGAWAPEL